MLLGSVLIVDLLSSVYTLQNVSSFPKKGVMIDEATRRFIFSLIFLVISSVVTYVMSSSSLQSAFGKAVGKQMTSHESSVASGLVDASSIDETLASVGGLSHIKDDLSSTVITPLKYARAFFHPKMKSLHVPRGVLLTGPPGCGKTLLARALAKECGCKFLSVSLSTLEDKYFGETSKRIEAVFSLARKVQPCIVFFDELDGFLRTRSEGDQSCVYSLKTELLSQLDGFHKRGEAVVVVACTNSTQSLDPAVRRRLPRVYAIGLPNEEEREQILRLHAKSERLPDSISKWIASETEGFSGSDLLELYRAASAQRIRDRCSDPDFHASASKACSDASALSDLARSLSRISRDQWKSALSVMTEGKKGKDFIDEMPPPP